MLDGRHAMGRSLCRRSGSIGLGHRRSAYLLLETVIATGLLIAGLAVIGAQFQSSGGSVRRMQRRVRAITLAELKLAELDMGLVELDSFDEMEEEDFGPRFPDYGWRLITEETSIDDLFLLELEVLHHRREDDYRPDEFDFDNSERILTVYSFRAAPRPMNLVEDFGLNEEEAAELGEQLADLGIEGLDIDGLDPALLARLDFEEFIEVLPLLAEVFGFDLTSLMGSLPPDMLRLLQGSGALGGDDGATGDGDS